MKANCQTVENVISVQVQVYNIFTNQVEVLMLLC